MNDSGKIVGVFGLGGLGALIGAVLGALGGGLLGLVVGGFPALNWFYAQPPDWWIVSGTAAIVFTLVVAIVGLVVGAVVGALILGCISIVTSSLWAAKQS